MADAPDWSALDAALETPGEKSESAPDWSSFDEALGKGQNDEPTGWSTAASPFVGFNKGLADVVGAPVDLTNWAMSKVGIPTSEKPFGGSESIKRGLGVIGANPDAMPPKSNAERILQASGEGAASMMVPEAGLAGVVRSGALKAAPKTAEILESTLGSGKPSSIATNAVMGLGAGAGGESAGLVAPEGWEPLARMGGSLVGGGLGAIGSTGVSQLPIMARKASDLVAPFTASGRDRLAGQTLVDRASNPGVLSDRLETGNTELIPGSKPTTFQATGDMGLGQLEREATTASPEQFNARRAEQNSARVDALGQIQPQGSPQTLPAYVRSRFADLDAQATKLDDLEATGVQQKVGDLGGTGTPEGYGNDLRGYLSTAKDTIRKWRSGLYKAISPDGKLNIVATPVKEQANTLYHDLSPMAAQPTGEEAGIRDAVRSMPDVAPFNDLTALDSRITAAMSEERRKAGETPLWGRLSRLKSSVAGAIDDAVKNQAQHEATSVQAGEMAPEQTMEARLAAQRADFLASRKAESVGNSGTGNVPSAGPRQVGASRDNGTISQTGRGPDANAGAQGVQGEALSPNADQAAIDRLNAAKQAHALYAQTYRQGPVGKVLKTNGFSGQYQIPDAKVVDHIFAPGKQGFDNAQAFRKAVGNDPAAVSTALDYATSSMLRAAKKTDGTIDPGAFNQWKDSHQDALRAFPELNSRFTNAAQASETAANAAKTRRETIDNYQKGTLGEIMNINDPADVSKTVGSLFGRHDSVAQMRKLANFANRDPDAKAGLRKAIADYMTDKFISNTEAGTSGNNLMRSDQFQRFVRGNRDSLLQVFTPKEIGGMGAIAADLRRSNRSIVSSKIPGGSNSPQDLFKAIKEAGGKDSHLGLFGKIGAGSIAGAETFGDIGAIIGGATAGGQHFFSRFREAGMDKVRDLVRDALLDPGLAHSLVSKVPLRGGMPGTSDTTLAKQLSRLSMYGPIIGAKGNAETEQEPRPLTIRRAGGGRTKLTADHYIAMVPKIRKQIASETEPLLNVPDDTVVHALGIAKRAMG